MIVLLAQTLPNTVPIQSLSVSAILAALVALMGAARIFYVLSGDLEGTQPVLTDPIRFALKDGTTFDDIQKDRWKGMRAFIVAQRLDELLTRYWLFLRTKEGSGVCFLFAGLFILGFIYASMVPGGASAQDYLLKVAGLIAVAWSVLIEKCKALKKSVEILQLK